MRRAGAETVLRRGPGGRAGRLALRSRATRRGGSSATSASRRSPARFSLLGGIVAEVVQVVAGEPGRRPRTAAGRPRERLADHRARRAGHAVEHGAVVGQGQPSASGRACDRHRRPAVRPHRQRRVVADRARARTSLVASMRCTSRPQTPASAQLAHRRRLALGSAARASGRACGAAPSTPNRSASVAKRSTLVVSASHVAPAATPGQATISGMCPSGS